jgi:lipopolysaccharide export LptBFGC system permease protein LptF
MEISGKWFLVITIIIAAIAVTAVMVAANIFGLGTALAGFGGPIASGLYQIFAFFPRWILGGGWPTMIAGLCIVLILMVASGYLFEQKHIIATITGKNQDSTTGTFQDSPTQTIPITGLQDAPSDNRK